jgi:hypothetical protein
MLSASGQLHEYTNRQCGLHTVIQHLVGYRFEAITVTIYASLSSYHTSPTHDVLAFEVRFDKLLFA